MYETASEMIREGLRLLKERDERQAQLRADGRAGFAEVERGRYVDYDDHGLSKLARQIKTGGRRNLARTRKTTNTTG